MKKQTIKGPCTVTFGGQTFTAQEVVISLVRPAAAEWLARIAAIETEMALLAGQAAASGVNDAARRAWLYDQLTARGWTYDMLAEK